MSTPTQDRGILKQTLDDIHASRRDRWRAYDIFDAFGLIAALRYVIDITRRPA